MEKSQWYFVGSIHDRGPIHVEHDFISRDDAERKAGEIFQNGVIVDGGSVSFDQVICISEHHEICFHTTKNNQF